MKYLDSYYRWMNAMGIPGSGLCNSLRANKQLKFFFAPEGRRLIIGRGAYWAYSGASTSIQTVAHEFCPLRQNIVLLLAAMNGEL